MKKTGMIIFLLLPFTAWAQLPACEIVYDDCEVMARFKGGEEALMQLLQKKVLPVIQEYQHPDSIRVSKIILIFTIDTSGRIIYTDVRGRPLSEACKLRIMTELSSGNTWIPAKQNGRTVCCRISIPLVIDWKE